MNIEQLRNLKLKLTPQTIKGIGIGTGVLALVVLLRSCGGEKQMPMIQTAPALEQKSEKASDGAVDVTANPAAGRNADSFAGFKFGMPADKFGNLQPVTGLKFMVGRYTNYYEKAILLKRKIRYFDVAVLRFTRHDKRLFSVSLQTSEKSLGHALPSSVLRESQYCAQILERKYGGKFNLLRTSSLYEHCQDEKGWGSCATLLESGDYAAVLHSNFAIAPTSRYHGFFNAGNVEVECSCMPIKGDDDSYLGISICAVDHRIIEQDCGRTKALDLGADDDADDF